MIFSQDAFTSACTPSSHVHVNSPNRPSLSVLLPPPPPLTSIGLLPKVPFLAPVPSSLQALSCWNDLQVLQQSTTRWRGQFQSSHFSSTLIKDLSLPHIHYLGNFHGTTALTQPSSLTLWQPRRPTCPPPSLSSPMNL